MLLAGTGVHLLGRGMKRVDALAAPAHDNALAVCAGAVAVLGVGMIGVSILDAGPFAKHMIVHIAAMNVAAPLIAAALNRALFPVALAGLWTTALAQMGLLWALHSPAVHHAAHSAPLLLVALHFGLFLAALAFWTSIVNAGARRWQAMLALILSGKFACLLGALLVFAPRPLFGLHAGHGIDSALLEDQHTAGLLMIAACPLSYVLAAVVIASQAIIGLEKARTLPGSVAPDVGP